ncbi:MAG: DinB family protein, partial [Mycobacteriales bacterium]
SDADEKTMLTAWLDWLRISVHRRCEGLADDDAYAHPLPKSPLMTIAGIVTHLRWTEHYWFEHEIGDCTCLGPDDPGAVGEPADPDSDFRIDGVPIGRVLADYEAACQGARGVIARLDLSARAHEAPPGDEPVSLRWIIVHMIEETARHLGHLDAIRELTDGVTGD